VRLLEHFAGLHRFGSTPPARPHTVAYRLIAAILNLQLSAGDRWRVELDFAGETWSGLPVPAWGETDGGQRWILRRGDEPVLSVTPESGTTGHADGAVIDVWALYKTDGG